ncbi:MAG: DUF4129 domain-containing protein [Candidatus Nanopelagicales bacterium]|jgi:hypothetical protein|nr:DUF4129 domain-containing protein [Candidatus Nanopelagicales bacterium]
MRLPGEVPVDLTGEQGRALARRELADPAYRAAEPSLLQQAIGWVVERVQRLVEQAGEAAPGGWLGILGLVTLVVLAVLFLRWRLGPVRGAAGVTFAVDPSITAAEYRQQAAGHAAAGAWDAALRARMRALVRGAQERGLVDAQPGWTADEVARALGGHAPQDRALLDRAATAFDEVAYGGRPATGAAYRAVAAADDRIALLPAAGPSAAADQP